MIPVSAEQLAAANESYRKPVFRLGYVDTPYGVDTLGYTAEYYNDPYNASSLVFNPGYRVMRGKENILSNNWELGAPPGVSSTNYFKARYYGYFYARFTGTYSFFISKEPSDYVRMYIDTTRTVSPTDTGSYGSILIDEWGGSTFNSLETVSGDVTLTAGNWYPMLIDFAEREDTAYIVARYREPDGVQDANGNWSDYDSQAVGHNEAVEHRKILSAGVFANRDSWADADDAAYLTNYLISSATDVSLEIESNRSNTLKFTVPLFTNVLNTSGLKGFRFDPDIQLYRDDESGVILRQGRLIKYYSGYAVDVNNPADTDYIQRFEGIITDIEIDKGTSKSSISVTCQDLMYFMITQINENYPDVTSYVANDFVTNSNPHEPAGLTRPVAYDAWPIEAVVRDLAVKSGIDPTKLYGRRKFLSVRPGNVSQSASNVIATGTGDYKIESQNIVLRRRPRYGNPQLSNENKDDTYIWATNFGDTIYDIITDLSDKYGFDLDFDNEGDFRFSSVSAATTFGIDHHAVSYGNDWQVQKDLGADYGKYIVSNERDAAVTIQITGAEFAVNFVKENSGDYWINQSSWSIVYNELPSGTRYDPSVRDQFSAYGAMYGRRPFIIGDRYIRFSYPITTVYVRPTKDIEIEELHIKYNDGDYPEGHENNALHLAVDIWIGEVQGGDYRNLVASSQLMDSYARPNTIGGNVIRLTEDDGLSVGYTLEAGKIYGIRFESLETGTPPLYFNSGEAPYYRTRNSIYTMEYMSLESTATTHRAGVWYKSYNPSTGTWTEDTYETYDDDNNRQAYHNITILGAAINLGGDPTASRALIEVRPAIYNGTTFTTNPTYSTIVDNIYQDRVDTNEPYRYPSDGKDFTGENPCVVYLRSEDIGLTTSGNIAGPHNYYQITIKNLAAGQSTRFASIDAFDEGLKNPSWRFDTSKNIISMQMSESIDDTRNDVLVVGDKTGAFTQAITDEVINPNNPSLQYIYSRATDISSINEPSSRNSIGRKKPFLIFEPGLVDQKHADWLAQEVLVRYHAFRQTPNWKSWAIPFIEIGDNVFISDRTDGIESANTNINNGQWIISMSEKISNANYFMDIQTTPYEPWASFVPNPNPSITDFGGLPFVNVVMTDSKGNLRGYDGAESVPIHAEFDVYESESGNRLQLKYDQVIDGDIIVKVMSKSVLGQPFTRNVAYLVGGIDEDGNEKPEYREWGRNYTVSWDGIDQFGDVRRRLGFNTSISEDGSEYTVQLLNMDFIAGYDQPGFYAPSGEYFVRFIMYPRDTLNPASVVDSQNLSVEYNQAVYDILYPNGTDTTYAQTWQIKWGDLSEMYMLVSGQRPGNSERDLTYGFRTFHSDENNNRGVFFKFNFDPVDNVVNRTIYYKVNLDHYWNVGYTFVLRSDRIWEVHQYDNNNLRDDWWTAFNIFAEHSYMARRHGRTRSPGNNSWEQGDYWPRYAYLTDKYRYDSEEGYPMRAGLDADFYLPANTYALDFYKTYHIRGYHQEYTDNENIYRDYMPSALAEKHAMDIDYFCSISPDQSNDPNDFRVIAWKQVPYTRYDVTDFIPQTKHVYSDANPIVFYMNPVEPRAGGWSFDGLPDMSSEQLHSLLDQLPMAAFYAGPQHINDPIKRLNFCTSHTFQVNVLIWDNTGRLIGATGQGISQGPIEHQHGFWTDNIGSFNYTGAHTHDSPETLVMQPKVWSNHRNLGFFATKNQFLQMNQPGTTNPNWGVGYCNITGMGRYGYWTWHGSWVSDDHVQVHPTVGGFAQHDYDRGVIEGTDHWIHYDLWSEFDPIGAGRTVMINWTDTNNNNKKVKLEVSGSHGHWPYYEGQLFGGGATVNWTADDPDGITIAMIEKNEWEFPSSNPDGAFFSWSEESQDEGWQYNPINRTKGQADRYPWYIMEVPLPYYDLTDDDPQQHKTWGNFLWSKGVSVDGTPRGGLSFPYGGWSHLSSENDEEN